MTREPSYPPWWQTMEQDPWYITGAKALLGEREVEGMRHGEVMPWVENILPLLFMGKGPKGRVMPELPGGGPELPPPPGVPKGLVSGKAAEMDAFTRFENGLTDEHMAMENAVTKAFADKGITDMNADKLRTNAFYASLDSPNAYMNYLRSMHSGAGTVPTSSDQLYLEGGDVMPVPGQPPLTMGQRSDILSGNIPKNINPKEDFKNTILPDYHDQIPFKWMDRGKPGPIDSDSFDPTAGENLPPGHPRWEQFWTAPNKGLSWSDQPPPGVKEILGDTILPDYHDQVPFKWMDRGKLGPLEEPIEHFSPAEKPQDYTTWQQLSPDQKQWFLDQWKLGNKPNMSDYPGAPSEPISHPSLPELPTPGTPEWEQYLNPYKKPPQEQLPPPDDFDAWLNKTYPQGTSGMFEDPTPPKPGELSKPPPQPSPPPPPFMPPGDTSEPPTGWPPWWQFQAGSEYVPGGPSLLHQGEAVLNPGAAEIMGRDQIAALNAAGNEQQNVIVPENLGEIMPYLYVDPSARGTPSPENPGYTRMANPEAYTKQYQYSPPMPQMISEEEGQRNLRRQEYLANLSDERLAMQKQRLADRQRMLEEEMQRRTPETYHPSPGEVLPTNMPAGAGEEFSTSVLEMDGKYYVVPTLQGWTREQVRYRFDQTGEHWGAYSNLKNAIEASQEQ